MSTILALLTLPLRRKYIERIIDEQLGTLALLTLPLRRVIERIDEQSSTANPLPSAGLVDLHQRFFDDEVSPTVENPSRLRRNPGDAQNVALAGVFLGNTLRHDEIVTSVGRVPCLVLFHFVFLVRFRLPINEISQRYRILRYLMFDNQSH
jgi:hypothetical protein